MQDQSGSSQNPMVKDLLFFGEGIDEGLENVFYLHLFFFFFWAKALTKDLKMWSTFTLIWSNPSLIWVLNTTNGRQGNGWVFGNLFGPNQGDPLINQTKIQPPELIGRVETRSEVSHSVNFSWRSDMYNIYEV